MTSSTSTDKQSPSLDANGSATDKHNPANLMKWGLVNMHALHRAQKWRLINHLCDEKWAVTKKRCMCHIFVSYIDTNIWLFKGIYIKSQICHSFANDNWTVTHVKVVGLIPSLGIFTVKFAFSPFVCAGSLQVLWLFSHTATTHVWIELATLNCP